MERSKYGSGCRAPHGEWTAVVSIRSDKKYNHFPSLLHAGVSPLSRSDVKASIAPKFTFKTLICEKWFEASSTKASHWLSGDHAKSAKSLSIDCAMRFCSLVRTSNSHNC